MFKKSMIVALCLFAAVSVFAAPKIRIYQTTKNQTVESYIRALAYDDADAMWQLIDPELRTQMIKEASSEPEARKQFWEAIRQACPRSMNAQLKEILADPEQKQAAIAEMMKMVNGWMVKKNGKWYLNPMQR